MAIFKYDADGKLVLDWVTQPVCKKHKATAVAAAKPVPQQSVQLQPETTPAAVPPPEPVLPDDNQE